MLERRITTIWLECTNEISDLWKKRIATIKKIIDQNVDCIHSDADAVWIKNPLRNYLIDKEKDLVISQGTIWPKDVFMKWGFVLCCGLFYVQASWKTKNLFNEIKEDVDLTKDDQISLNRIILSDNIKWKIDEGYELGFNKYTIKCSESVINGQGQRFKISVLPQHLFQRLHIERSNPYVKHILSNKQGEDTIEVIRRAGCYFYEEKNACRNSLLNFIYKKIKILEKSRFLMIRKSARKYLEILKH